MWYTPTMTRESIHRHVDAILSDHVGQDDNTGAMRNVDPARRLCWKCLERPSGDGASGVCDVCRQILLDEVYAEPPVDTMPATPPFSGTLEINIEDLIRVAQIVVDYVTRAIEFIAQQLRPLAEALVGHMDAAIREATRAIEQGQEWIECDPGWLHDTSQLLVEILVEMEAGPQVLRVRANTSVDPPPASDTQRLVPREDLAGLEGQLGRLLPGDALLLERPLDGTAEATDAPLPPGIVYQDESPADSGWFVRGWCGRVPIERPSTIGRTDVRVTPARRPTNGQSGAGRGQ